MKSLKLFVISSLAFGSLMLGLAKTAYADHHEGGHDKAAHGHSWKDADANKDGAVNKEEFMAKQQARAEKKFAKLDANNDGKVDEAEIKAMHQKCEHHKK